MKRWIFCASAGWMLVALHGAGCATGAGSRPAVVDAEWQRAAEGAKAAFDAGSPAAAGELYRTALRRAQTMDNAAEILRAAYNLAICEAASGRWEAARVAIRTARFEAAPRSSEAGMCDLVEAKIAFRLGQTEEARALLTGAQENLGDGAALRDQAQLTLLTAALAAEKGEFEAADAALAAARRRLRKASDWRLDVEAADTAARLAERRGRSAAAAEWHDAAAALLRTNGQYADMAQALQDAGAAYGKAGQAATAAERYFRAGRSRLHAPGGAESGALLLRLAAEWAEKAGDRSLLARIKAVSAPGREGSQE
jgi:hypothetical protein